MKKLRDDRSVMCGMGSGLNSGRGPEAEASERLPKKEEIQELANAWIQKNIPEPFALIIPAFVRRIGNKVEFYDPVEDLYMLEDLKKIQEWLDENYRCSNCGGFHLTSVIDITDPTKPRRLFFSEFLRLSELGAG
jgi:hypothetical protein